MSRREELLGGGVRMLVVGLDGAGRVTSMNRHASEVSGLTEAEALGHPFRDLLPPEQADLAEMLLAGLTAESSPPSLRAPLPARDGAVAMIDWRFAPVVSEDGEMEGVLAVGVEVSETVCAEQERLEAEAAVVEQAHLMDAFFSGGISPLSILDRDLNYVRVNDAFARIFGWRAEDFVGRNRFDVLGDPGGVRPIFEEVVRTGRPFSIQAQPMPMPLHPEQGIRYWDWSVEPLLNDAGEVEYLVLASLDVTERVRAEQERQEAQERLTDYLGLHEASFAQSLACLVLLDRDFNFLQVNEAYARACGMQVSDFAGRNHFELFPSDAKAVFEEVVRTKEPSIVTARAFSFPDHPEWGVTYWDWVLQPILGDEGEVRFLRWMLQDVTSRKQAEDALMEYQQDLRYLASKLALAEERARRAIAIEIHDGLGQQLAVMRIKLSDLRQTAILPEVEVMASDLLGQLTEAIQYARFLTFELSPPVLYDLGLEPALDWLADQFRHRYGLDLELEDDGLPKPLSQDLRITLFRSVRELLTNVYKHAEATHVRVSLTRDGPRMQLEVEDDGCGFDTSLAEDQHPREQGGFGLFSVIERMRHLGGSVEIVARPGGGTLVRLVAPLDGATALAEEEGA